MENKEINNAIKEWEKCVKAWATALKKQDTEVADIMRQRTLNAYEDYKKEAEYVGNLANANAGELGSMFESALPSLFVKNRNAVKSVLKLIKEDNNLRGQLQFFNAMKNYDGTSNARDYIKESVDLIKRKLDRKTINESNDKLRNIFAKYGIKFNKTIDENEKSFTDAGTYLLTNDKKIGNLNEMAKKMDIIEKYINANKKTVNENKTGDIIAIAENFDKNLSMLNEDERNLVQDILNVKSSVAETRQIKFFNSLKEKCITKIDRLLTESTDTEKAALESIRKEINEMVYNKDSIIKDTAKLLEIGAVLSDSDNKKYM